MIDTCQLSRLLTYQLGKIGLDVVSAGAANAGLALARHRQPDLVLISDTLTHADAHSVCSQVRSLAPGALVVICSAEHVEPKPTGTAADHYLSMSDKMPRLLGQIKSLLWRGKAYMPAENMPPMVAGDVTVDLRQCEVSLLGRKVEVTVKEAELLYFLARKSPHYVDREMILNCVWNSKPRGHTDTRLDVFIFTLRRKIEPNPQYPRYVIYRRGVGYKLSTELGGESVEAASTVIDKLLDTACSL